MSSLRVKVCGLTRPQDVRLCLDLDVDFTGFIFAEKSPRRVSPESAAAFPSGNAARVGVFAGQSPEAVVRIMSEARLDYVQLHGGEEPAFCRAVGPERVIKVLWPERLLREAAVPDSPGDPVGPAQFRDRLERECRRFADVCAYFLLDAGSGGGGSGRQLDSQGFAGFNPPRPWLMAGGVGPANAAVIVDACAPFGLDCNSALESGPGVKDQAKLHALMAVLQPWRD